MVADQGPKVGARMGTSEDARVRGERRLLVREEVIRLLYLSDEQLQLLISTRQLVPIMIAGEERFDSRDLDLLIESYKSTALRRLK
jgi:hypothetical protein